MRRWDYRKYASLADPAHKSHMSDLVGSFACGERFRRDRDAELLGEPRKAIAGKTAMGTAGHETIARALSADELRSGILGGDPAVITEAMVRRVVEVEYRRETTGLEVIWYGKTEYEATLDKIVEMALGVLRDVSRYVAEVVLVEAGFIAPLGRYWIEGHIDLVYRPRSNPSGLASTDWKTGAQRPSQIELDHGYESGFYSTGLRHGIFLPLALLRRWTACAREDADPSEVPLDPEDVIQLSNPLTTERQAMHVALRCMGRRRERGEPMPEGVVELQQFPDEIYLTHLADYEAYKRKGKKAVDRPEELAFWDLQEPGDVQYVAGQRKGPAWYRVRRSEDDIARLERRLRSVVGMVRLGCFTDAVGEQCNRCQHRGPCLTSGYELRGDEAKAAAAAFRGVDVTGFEGLDEL